MMEEEEGDIETCLVAWTADDIYACVWLEGNINTGQEHGSIWQSAMVMVW